MRASAQAEVDALQARIRPHFLFNCMNTIASLVRTDPATAERAVEDLSDLFRAALGAGEERVEPGRGNRPGRALPGDRSPAPGSAPAGALARASSRCRGRCRCRGWCCSRCSRTRCCTASRGCRQGGASASNWRGGRPATGRWCRNPAPPPDGNAAAAARHAQQSIVQRLAYHFGPRARMTAAWHDGDYRCELAVPVSGKAG